MEAEPPSSFLFLAQQNDSTTAILCGVFLILLLICSAFVSGSEVAYFSLSKKDLEDAKHSKPKHLDSVVKLLQNKKQLLATILILNNFVNIAIVLLAAFLSQILLHPLLSKFNPFKFDLILIFDLVVITFLLLFFGEIIPKIYAGRNSIQLANRMAKPLQFFVRALSFLSAGLMGISDFVEKRWKKESSLSVDQLSQALELTSEDETTTTEEQKILEGIVAFGNTDTDQIMTPRVDMFSLKTHYSFEDVIQEVSQNGYSRVPVHNNQIDEIEGILYAKDLIPYLNQKDFKWQQLLRQPFFVPETKKLNDLLQDFQERKIHLAIVVDEYGGTSGLVTLEDVIEEIVGDISDEFDDDDIFFSKLDDYNYIFEGKTSLKDLCKILNLDDDIFDEIKGEAETLAGLILEITEEYPKKRQKIQTEYLDFFIEAIDKKRIKQVKVTKTNESITDED